MLSDLYPKWRKLTPPRFKDPAMRFRTVPLAAAALAMAGCTQIDTSVAGINRASDGTVRYVCSSDYPLVATFHKEPSKVVIEADGRTSELEQVPTASGTRYQGNGMAFWVRGYDVFWNRKHEALFERAPGAANRVCYPEEPPAPAAAS